MKIFYSVLLFCISFFSSAQEAKLMLPIGHSSNISSIVFSKDGSKVVTASWDQSVRLWEVKSGGLIAVYKDPSFWILSACFSPDEKNILIAGMGQTIKLWDPSKDEIKFTLTGHHSKIFAASYSPDGKKIVSASLDSTAKIWDATNGALLLTLKGHTNGVLKAKFSADNKYILTGSNDSTARFWDANTGALLFTIRLNKAISEIDFSPDQKQIITNRSQLWNAKDGSLIKSYAGTFAISGDGKIASQDDTGNYAVWDAKQNILFKMEFKMDATDAVESMRFTPDSKLILLTTRIGKALVWDVATGKMISKIADYISYYIKPSQITPDGQYVAVARFFGDINLYSLNDGQLIKSFKGLSYSVEAANFSPDQKQFVTASNSVKVWDAEKGILLMNLKTQNEGVYSVVFSGDGDKILAAEFGGIEIWDAHSGKLIMFVPVSSDLLEWSTVYSAEFSPDAKLIVEGVKTDVRILDAVTGKLITNLTGHTSTIRSVAFSPDGKNIASASFDKTLKIWDVASGKLIQDGHSDDDLWSLSYSKDGKKIVTAAYSKVELWDAATGKVLKEFKDAENAYRYASFSDDGKKIITTTIHGVTTIWDAASATKINEFTGHENTVTSARLDSSGERLLTSSTDNTVKVWNVKTASPLFTILPLNNKDYLVIDKSNRYDGSENARKTLYFTCGTEVIELDQVKDQLWVPGLAERIIKNETINAKTLSDLSICGLTPEVNAMENTTGYQFNITPRRGGLGETILYVNGIEAHRYTKQQLKKTASGYDLTINKEELKDFFAEGKENAVSVKSYTAANDIASRGVEMADNEQTKSTTPPNLYAVVVGVSDYKGDDMDLKYAAKDATDIGNALKVTASKMLNTDNKEHVFIYNLTTNAEHYLLPEKNSIKNVLAEIGKKATANDILLIFFAGHGVMFGEKKQFYFLTADASHATAVNSPADVGISTQELSDWMKPQTIKAQKRILIFDACNSGQAIKDFVKLGDDKANYIAARSDDKGQQIKAIEKLNERSGLFILSASASNQSAYEFSRYSQGLLTYSLLKAIKQQPDILEDKKYLNISRWFDAAEKTVTEAVRETGNQQEPQLVSTTNFNIGIVDNDVISKINLPQEKPLFTSSKFFNKDENILDDNLELKSKINDQLSGISSRGRSNPILFVENTNSNDAYSLTGSYLVTGDNVTCNVNVRYAKETKLSFEVKGTKNALDKLADQIVAKTLSFIAELKDKKTAGN